MMMARASLARSRAVVTWRSSGRPLTLARPGQPVRLVQRQVGRLLANNAARADRCAGCRRR